MFNNIEGQSVNHGPIYVFLSIITICYNNILLTSLTVDKSKMWLIALPLLCGLREFKGILLCIDYYYSSTSKR